MRLFTSAAVARWLNISERRVRQLRDEGVLTEYRPGFYDLQTATHQYIKYIKKNDGEEGLSYNTERAKLIRAKREAQELELKLRKNEVHTSEDIEQVMTDMLIKFKARMMAIPAKLSPVIANKNDKTEIFKLMKESIDEALEELSDFKTVFGEVENNEEGD